MNQSEDGAESRVLQAVNAIAIRPEEAIAIVDRYREQVLRSRPSASHDEVWSQVSRKIVERYARLAATSGGITSLAGVIPGVGTAVALVGGGLADVTACMKLQVDMVYCLAAASGWDLTGEDARHVAFLIAAGGSLEKLGVETGVKLASEAGVRMLRQYLRGAALVAAKQMFKKVGVVFTRQALEKVLPFGIGVVVSSSANYALTRYVGRTASEWFVLDAKADSAT